MKTTKKLFVHKKRVVTERKNKSSHHPVQQSWTSERVYQLIYKLTIIYHTGIKIVNTLVKKKLEYLINLC